MPLYTLCPNYVNYGCDENDDFVDVMIRFCQTNGLKVALDVNDKLIDEYKTVVKNQSNFSTWFKLLTNRTDNYEIIDIEFPDDLGSHEMVISICGNTYDSLLTCFSKDDYLSQRDKINELGIKLFDKNELKDALTGETTTIGTQIIQKSRGDNSPNVAGNQNKTNL